MHEVKNLVISCIDFRFRPKVSEWIDQTLGGESDLVCLAGSSKSINDESSQKIILNQLHIASELHGIQTVYILDHIDCGAYGGSDAFNNKKNDEIAMHTEALRQSAQIIVDHFPNLTIQLYIADFDTMLHVASS